MLLSCLLLALAFQDTSTYPDPGPHAVASKNFDWNDAERKRDVPVKIYYPQDVKTPVPVILWSHGLGGNREAYVYLGRFWASHGYIVVHLQHKGSDSAVLREGGMQALRTAGNARNAVDRPKDITFVIDQLMKLNQDQGEFKGRFNLDAIGVGGHSFGAQTTLLAGGQKLGPTTSFTDSRVKALMPMSAPVPAAILRERAYQNIKLPIMHMTGTKDDSPISETKAAERRIPFDKIAGCPQWFINFQDGDHMIFSGRMARAESEQKKQDLVFQKLIKQCSLTFWNAHLKKDAQALDWLNNQMKTYLGKHAASVETKR